MPIRHLQYLRAAWDDVSTSFWFVPTLVAISGGVMAALAPALDAWAGERVPFAYVIAREDALQLLGTILTSMITMTSLVFSITMVVLTLAATQFGPRLIRTYMARRQTQLVLGTFALTIVFCLLLIARVGQTEGQAASAPASIPAAVGLTLVSVLMLILHIHLLARSMLSETIIELVGRELDEGISELAHLRDGGTEEEPAAVLPADFDKDAHLFGPPRQGYVQAIDFADLVETAEAADVLIGFRFRAGDYLIAGGRQIGVHPAASATEELQRRVAGAFTLGPHRTPVQDAGFSIRHLVEIAARALSPGVNDPYTAAAVVDRLSGSLSRLMAARMPPGVFRDGAGWVRVVCERPTHASLVGVAFDQIRQSGADKPLVLIHLARTVGRIADVLRTRDQAQALRDQLRLIAETAEAHVGNGDDRAAVARAVGSAREALDDAERRLTQAR
jgi:uncharacterized membrane protein